MTDGTGTPLRSAYGLRIASALELPELPLAEAGDVPADVRIRFGVVAADGLPGEGRQLGPFLWAGPRTFWLEVPQVARYLIRNGNDICIDPAPGSDPDSLRVFLLGSGFGALLFQRGLLVLHGNAVRIGGQCMVCVGPSGAGKSTLAAAFLQRGYPVMADDVVPVDADCRALSGVPRIKLWQDAASQFGLDTGTLRRIRPGLEKFSLPVAIDADATALPVRWIYILSSSNHERDFVIRPIQGMQRFQPLRSNTYRMSYLQGMGLGGDHLGLVGRLAGRIHLAQVVRPVEGFTADALAGRILADIAAHP